jgi:hypothetical protein
VTKASLHFILFQKKSTGDLEMGNKFSLSIHLEHGDDGDQRESKYFL